MRFFAGYAYPALMDAADQGKQNAQHIFCDAIIHGAVT
eukprot:COSAG06_NODE_14760_length_1128_cov_1.062196_2_plen_37_part_01